MVPSTLNIVDMQGAGRERMQTLIIKRIHVKSINVTIKQGTKAIHRIEYMDTFFLYHYRHFSKLILVLPQSHLR